MSPDPDDPEPVRIQSVAFSHSVDRWVANTACQLCIYCAHAPPVLDNHLTPRCYAALSVGMRRRNHVQPRMQQRMPHLWNLRMYRCRLQRLNRQAPKVLRIQRQRRAARSEHLSQHVRYKNLCITTHTLLHLATASLCSACYNCLVHDAPSPWFHLVKRLRLTSLIG
jgi:hypothetical protein